MKDSNSDADVDALEGLGFVFAAARRSQLVYSSMRALSQLPRTKMERRRIHATRRDAEQSARCARAVRPLRRSKRQRESNVGAARSEAAPARSEFSASQNVGEFATTTRFGQIFDVQMVSSARHANCNLKDVMKSHAFLARFPKFNFRVQVVSKLPLP